MINFKATKVFQDTWNALTHRTDNKITYKIIIQEGSSRSSKTWSDFQALFLYIHKNRNKSCVVLRDTATSCYANVEKDFIDWIKDPMCRMKEYEEGKISIDEALELINKEELSQYLIRNKQLHTWTNIESGSVIRFSGLDDEDKVMGMTNDIVWVNEPYSFSEEVFKQLLQRTKQILFDWNPKQKHFITEQGYKEREDVITLHSTYKNNPFCPETSKRQLDSYQPLSTAEVVEKGLIQEKECYSYDLEENKLNFTNKQLKELKVCLYNEETKSASLYHYNVYCLGIGAERPHRIFHWESISLQQYYNIDTPIWIGVDWGKSDPFGIIEVKYYDGALYVNELNYQSENKIKDKLTTTERTQIEGHEEGLVIWLFNKLGINKNYPIVCDNNRPDKVIALRKNGFDKAVTADKGAGSILEGIDTLLGLKVYYTSNSINIAEEQENYSRKVDRHGAVEEEPEDANNHTIDPLRYVAMKMKKHGIIKVI